jgi:hypothetical protein
MTDIAALATAARRSDRNVLTHVIGIGSLGDYDVLLRRAGPAGLSCSRSRARRSQEFDEKESLSTSSQSVPRRIAVTIGRGLDF